MRLSVLCAVLGGILIPFAVYGDDSAVQSQQSIAAAALQMRLKNYSSAYRMSVELPANGQRDLLLGIAMMRTGRNREAGEQLGKAARSNPLLADYALYYQAEAFIKGGQAQESVLSLRSLLKQFPDSPLARKSLVQMGNRLFDAGDYDAAEAVFKKIIDEYPSGSDAINASYRLAVCREKRGDGKGAMAMFRSLWLNSPGSSQAKSAEADMKSLASTGTAVRPYTPQELFKRASSLYDQRRYDQALSALREIPTKDEKRDFVDRVGMKTGNTLIKAKQFKEAEQVLQEIAQSDARVEVRSEAAYLAARAIDKSGRDEEALAAYLKVADNFPGSEEADDALLDAAFIRKFQNRPKDTVIILEKLLTTYPGTKLRSRAFWESGWANYLAGNYREAIELMGRVLSTDEYRERALYWHGRAAAASGENTVSRESLSLLSQEFPFGFYALQLPKNSAADAVLPKLQGDFTERIPLPEGFDRVKALMALGLFDDASSELAATRKKYSRGKSDAGIARLYTELGNYSGALNVFAGSMLKRTTENTTVWAFLYPKAFADLVVKYSERAGIDPSLAYAVMRSESSFSPTATSPVGARGLMQLMPKTAAQVLHEKSVEPERLYDPELNIRLGTKHLRELIDKYNGDQIAVIASYNAGAHNVNRWLKTYSNLKGVEFVESIPFAETRDYVKKVLATQNLYRGLYAIK